MLNTRRFFLGSCAVRISRLIDRTRNRRRRLLAGAAERSSAFA